MLEAVAVLVQMRGGFLHPNPNLEAPIDTECRFVGRCEQAASVELALSSSFGFGGINTCVVIERGDVAS